MPHNGKYVARIVSDLLIDEGVNFERLLHALRGAAAKRRKLEAAASDAAVAALETVNGSDELMLGANTDVAMATASSLGAARSGADVSAFFATFAARFEACLVPAWHAYVIDELQHAAMAPITKHQNVLKRANHYFLLKRKNNFFFECR